MNEHIEATREAVVTRPCRRVRMNGCILRMHPPHDGKVGDDELGDDAVAEELCVADIRNGDDARGLFRRIRHVMDGMLDYESDDAAAAKVELAAEHLSKLLSTWDLHNRLEECYRRAILDRCCELQRYMTGSFSFLARIALLTIGAAAQYAQPTAQRKLLPVSWGPLVDPRYMEELKAELADRDGG